MQSAHYVCQQGRAVTCSNPSFSSVTGFTLTLLFPLCLDVTCFPLVLLICRTSPPPFISLSYSVGCKSYVWERLVLISSQFFLHRPIAITTKHHRDHHQQR